MSTAVEVKPSMGDMVDSYPVLKARLLEELKPVEEDPLRPRIVNQWMQIGFCRAVMLHTTRFKTQRLVLLNFLKRDWRSCFETAS
ncbi:MAG: hypothetical protein HYU80_04690 [Candidatus Blackburnbacteria bacterium]|nr:hypothetical protein [Candidatus Blackburnbacteria bacterium]